MALDEPTGSIEAKSAARVAPGFDLRHLDGGNLTAGAPTCALASSVAPKSTTFRRDGSKHRPPGGGRRWI